MNLKPYKYKQLQSKQYLFISEGRKRIAKGVNFVQLEDNIVNLCFGDLLPDGSIDDRVNSNNGDIVKVLATVVDILRLFCSQHPTMQVYIEGSTELRTRLYSRILKTYYQILSKEFLIACIINDGNGIQIVPYDNRSDLQYLAFLIRKA